MFPGAADLSTGLGPMVSTPGETLWSEWSPASPRPVVRNRGLGYGPAMRHSSTLSVCLVTGALAISACKKGEKAPATKAQPATAPEAKAAPEKIAKPKAEPQKAEAVDAKNCLAPLEPASNFVPGTLVALPKPAGYRNVRHFPGYELDKGKGKTKPSIVVSEFPMAFSAAKNVLSNESIWSSREMQLVSAKDAEDKSNNGSCKGTLIELQKNGDDPLHKFVWLFGDKRQSFQVMATCPEPCPEAEATKLRQAAMSARWNPERKSRRYDGLAFSLNPLPLRPMEGSMMSGYRRTYTSTGEPDRKGVQKVFQVSSSVEPPKERTKEYAQERFQRLPLKNLEVKGSSKAKSRLLGLKGWTFEGKGNTRHSDAEQWITFTVFFDKETYWTALGMCPIAEKATCKPMFKTIMDSMQFIDAI